MLSPADIEEKVAGAVSPGDTRVRDRLATDRTTMANERTFLAYVRTSLALLLTGASAAHLPGLHPGLAFGPNFYFGVGIAFAVAGLIVFAVGYSHYRRFREQIKESAREDREPQS